MKRMGILAAATLLLVSGAVLARSAPSPASAATNTTPALPKVVSQTLKALHITLPATITPIPAHTTEALKSVYWRKTADAITAQTTPLTLTVTNTNDSGPGSLRDAVSQANANPGSTIRFDLPSYPAVITLTNGEIGLDSDMTIEAPGGDKLVALYSGFTSRIFSVGEATVTIDNLVFAGAKSSDFGGAISNAGNLTLEHCMFIYCGSQNGGAVANAHALTIRGCSFVINLAGSSGGALADNGTALDIVNSTFYFNISYGDGGALSLQGEEPATLTNTTIDHNMCSGNGGGVSSPAAEPALLNTIVAQNVSTSASGPNWYGAFTSNGHNLIGDTLGITHIHGPRTDDMYGTDPMLGQLGFYGGSTVTQMPLPGSPAINAGDDSVLGPPLSLTTDQRGPGFPRKLGAHVDIGACEAEHWMTLVDDSGDPQVCLGTSTGGFEWSTGTSSGPLSFGYYGRLEVYNGGTMFWSQPSASQYVYVYYDPNSHTAWGYLYDYSTGLYSSLYDSDTLNDPDTCIQSPAS